MQRLYGLVYSVPRQKHLYLKVLLERGKTEITELIRDYIEMVDGRCNYHFFQCVYGTDENEIMYKIVPTITGFKSVPGVLPNALNDSNECPTIIVLDEFDKTKPSADALLLDYIQNCRVTMIGEEYKTIYGKSR